MERITSKRQLTALIAIPKPTPYHMGAKYYRAYDIYINTNDGRYYIAIGATGDADWYATTERVAESAQIGSDSRKILEIQF